MIYVSAGTSNDVTTASLFDDVIEIENVTSQNLSSTASQVVTTDDVPEIDINCT